MNWNQTRKVILIQAMNPMEARELAPISQFILKVQGSLGINGNDQGYLHRDMHVTLSHV
jgi:hypothetical protein